MVLPKHVYTHVLAHPIPGPCHKSKAAHVRSPAGRTDVPSFCAPGPEWISGFGSHAWKNKMIQGDGDRDSWVIKQAPKGTLQQVLRAFGAQLWTQPMRHRENPHRPGNPDGPRSAVGMWYSSGRPCGPVTGRMAVAFYPTKDLNSVTLPSVENSLCTAELREGGLVSPEAYFMRWPIFPLFSVCTWTPQR